MDATSLDCDEPSVDEGAFWHTNMDLYYGYTVGEIVEVRHEPTKYWLARIQYCYKHLILLKWVGNYGEFWVDTSMTNANPGSFNPSAESNTPKRLYPLGSHPQSPFKSQFILERPTKILIAPSLYNPACDPYANIRTVDDLLALEDEEPPNKNDTFLNKSSNENLDFSLVCKKKIEYKQEDVDELEAALQHLDHIDNGESTNESPDTTIQVYKGNSSAPSKGVESGDSESVAINDQDGDNNEVQAVVNKDSGIDSGPSSHRPSMSPDRLGAGDQDGAGGPAEKSLEVPEFGREKADVGEDKLSDEADLIRRDGRAVELCKRLQASAIKSGRYFGLNSSNTEQTDEVFFPKPKQFFDMGGANHEKLFVPGTLLEVCHTCENSQGYQDIYFWFAYVLKNTGGRLTLRWYLCDDPKFKQGRLDLKSSGSSLVVGDSDQSIEVHANSETPAGVEIIPAKSITFSLHFCHPRIHTLRYAELNPGRQYQLPAVILNHLDTLEDRDSAYDRIISEHMSDIQDQRRINLDKDRPLIDHILTTARHRSPGYLDLVFAQKDINARREVLVSCPKLTKLLKATVVREIYTGVFEIHCDPVEEGDEIIKFIYPFDTSHAVLPLDWSINNEDCLSVNPSRNPTPDQVGESIKDTGDNSSSHHKSHAEHVTLDDPGQDKQDTMGKMADFCLKEIRNLFPKVGGPFKKVSDATLSFVDLNKFGPFNEFDPEHWGAVLAALEKEASKFHCCIDLSQKQAVESKFKVMDQLEVAHPSSDATICFGRIRKVVFPLLWIQLSTDCFTLIPYNSTDIYPAGWCNTHGHKLVSLLPPRKRCLDQPTQNASKKRKKTKASDDCRAAAKRKSPNDQSSDQLFEKEQFNLGDIYDRQLDFDFILQEKNNYIKIYFNHKCFTGPSLSKSKICSLPQYVGPGPMHLVLEEVVTKVISVAYVPPRILNDLTSKSFEELLAERQLTNTKNQTFKAKYQKRVHRERVPVCLDPKDIALYCECICEHLKCCYNLFGLNLYDGDDCPSHCRSLTKSNKFMKRATYYREKARQGEYLASEPTPLSTNKKSNSTSSANNSGSKTSRPRYAGRGSSDSTNSSILSRSEQVQSRASSSSSADGDGANSDLKENLRAVSEEAEHELKPQDQNGLTTGDAINRTEKNEPFGVFNSTGCEGALDDDNQNQPEFEIAKGSDQKIANIADWTVEQVAQLLDSCQLGMFKSNIEMEGIDGQALLLLDHDAISEHFEDAKEAGFSEEEVSKLCRFIEFVKTRAEVKPQSFE